MKWIGQHIVDFIARFRSDVYLEGITTSTETDMLVVDSDNKVSKRAIDAITVDVSDFMTNGVDNRVVTATGADALNAEVGLTFDGSTLIVDGDAEATSFTGLWDGGTIPIAKGGTGVTGNTTWLNSKITSKADGTFNYDGTTAVAPNHDSLAGFVSAEHVDWAGSSAGTIHSSNIPTLNQNTTGSAATLTTPRAINGVNFDGSGPITVPAAGSTLTDTVTVANGGTGLTTVGANNILTGNGAGALTAESTLTYDLEALTIGADDIGSATIKRLPHADGDGGNLNIIGGNATDGQTDKAGGDLLLFGGKSTGSAAGGNVTISTYETGSSGTSLAATTKSWVFSSGESVTLSSPTKCLGIKENVNFENETFETTLSDGDHTSSKVLIYGADESLIDGQIYFLHTNASWDLAQADDVATGASQLLGVGNGRTVTQGVILEGFIRVPDTEIIGTPVIGAPVYISETTAGHFDFDRPANNNEFVRVVGYCVDTYDDSGVDALIYFKPDNTWVKITA